MSLADAEAVAPRAGPGALLALCLLLCALPALALDVVLIVDSSGSNRHSDPQALRKAAGTALVELLAGAPDARIGILRFAGWLETEARGAQVHPLVALPAEAAARERVVAELSRAIADNILDDGGASDLNAAFGPAFEAMLPEPGARPLWLIVISDGALDVVEGAEVRPEYLERAGPGARRDDLNAAALALFQEETLPRLARRAPHCTLLQLGDGPSPAFDSLAESLSAERVRVRPDALLGALLASRPPDAAAWGLTLVQRRLGLPAGGTVQQPFRLPAGCAALRVAVFAGGDFALSLSGVEGEPVERGAGEPWRILTVERPGAGDGLLGIAHDGSTALDLDVWIGAVPDLTVSVEAAALTAARASSLPLIFASGGAVLPGTAPLPDFELRWKVGAEQGVTSVRTLALPPLPAGEATLELALAAFPDEEGRYAYRPAAVEVPLTVRPRALRVEADSLAFVGARLRLFASFTDGDAAGPDSLHLALRSPTLGRVPLARRGARYEGWLELPAAGRYRLAAPADAPFRLVSEVDVLARARSLEVRDAWAGEEPPTPFPLRRVASDRGVASLQAEVSRAPGEELAVELLVHPSPELATAVTWTLGGEPLTPDTWVTVEPGVPFELGLRCDAWTALHEVPARLDLRAEAGELLNWSRPLSVPPASQAEQLWAWWPVWLPAALLLLLGLFLWFGRPTWKDEQLKRKGSAVGAEKTPLRAWARGRSGAVGTAELPGTLRFRKKGLRYFHPRVYCGPQPGALVKVDNEKVYTETNLFHGSEIEVQAFDDEGLPQSVLYRYFAHPPTPQEEERDLLEEEESGGDFFVITDD